MQNQSSNSSSSNKSKRNNSAKKKYQRRSSNKRRSRSRSHSDRRREKNSQLKSDSRSPSPDGHRSRDGNRRGRKQINVRKVPPIEDKQNKQGKHEIKNYSEAEHSQNMNRYMQKPFWDSKTFNFTKSKKGTTFQCHVAH